MGDGTFHISETSRSRELSCRKWPTLTGWDTVSVTVTSTTTNRDPTAVVSANPTTVDVGQDVTFSGTSSFDTDGVVAEYLFTYGDGASTGWVASGTQTHKYTNEGAFTATLKVRDDDGAESELDTVRVTVVDTNEAPTANIVSIIPNPSLQGDEVTLTGSGTDPDGTIEAYSWESTFDGILEGAAEIKTKTLSVGTHTIIFKVQDDDGVWSEAVSRDVVVNANSKFTLEDTTKLPGQAYTDTLVEFRVVYQDADNDAPTLTNLVYSKGSDWKTAELRESVPADTNYVDGKEYYYNKKFSEADWTYHFEFRNSQHPESKTTDVKFSVKEPSGLLPALGAGAAMGAFLLAAVTVAVTIRRRKG